MSAQFPDKGGRVADLDVLRADVRFHRAVALHEAQGRFHQPGIGKDIDFTPAVINAEQLAQAFARRPAQDKRGFPGVFRGSFEAPDGP